MNICANYAPAFTKFENQQNRLAKSVNNKTVKTKKINKKAVGAASFLGAMVPVILLNAKKGKFTEISNAFKKGAPLKDKFKKITDLTDVEGVKEMGASITGSLVCGLGAGVMQDKNPENRKEKYKEGVYSFLNCAIPMAFVTGIELLREKSGIKPNLLTRAASVAGGIIPGMFVSNKVSNGLNKKLFKSEDEFQRREMKPTDCLVHIDDIMAVLVLSKFPFADKIGKALPLIYAHAGYETGTKEKPE